MKNNKFDINKHEKSNIIELMPKIGRNDLCYCGSGKKYKNCCIKKDQEKEYTKNLLEQFETVSDKYFTVKEYIELSGYPVTKFDFFLLEILNITHSTLYKYDKTSNNETKEITRKLYSYSKEFYKECSTCKYKCLKDPLKNIDFKSLIDKKYNIDEFPPKLQKKIAMNFFYIEFINGFAFKLEQELFKRIDIEIANEITGTLYWTIIDYVANNCSEKCGNECILEHKENAYCKFCTFGSKKLPCPRENEISYEAIKASETDMEH